MTKITQKQLIESLKQLKEIKPRKEWAVLLKSQILAEKKAEIVSQPARFVGITNVFSSVFSPRKLAYSFAVILFLVVGIFGLSKFIPQGKIPQQTAALTGQTEVAQNVAALKNLVKAAETQKTADSLALKNISAKAKDLALNLEKNPTQDPQTIKDIANSLKTLADVSGTDLASNSDVANLTQTTVQDLIIYYQGITLTADQKNILTQAEDLSSQGKYTDALEEIWTLTNNTNNLDNSANSTNLINTTTPTNK